jgi:uncharacterized oligopeptide transporter (OPT) family protein
MSYGAGTVIATALAALIMSGSDIGVLPATLWITALCLLGTLWTWPIREHLLDSLPFPSGRAAAETAKRMNAEKVPTSFSLALALAGVFTILREWWLSKLSLWASKFSISPSLMLVGLGALLGRSAFDMWLGGLFFFALPKLGVSVFPQAEDFVMFSIGMMLTAGVGASLPSLLKISTQTQQAFNWQQPRSWWLAVISLSLLTYAIQVLLFPQSWLLAVLTILMVPFFSFLASRVTGETDVVPTGALGKLSLICFGLTGSSGGQAPMLMTGTLAGTSAASADFMTDLRCGRDLKASWQIMFRYQCIGAVVGPLLLVPIFYWLIQQHTLGTETLPAPAARIWNTFAQLSFTESSFWANQGSALIAGSIGGIVGLWLSQKFSWFPSPLAFATAAFLDLPTVTTLALGALIAWIWRHVDAKMIWCAFVAGESVVMGFSLLRY